MSINQSFKIFVISNILTVFEIFYISTSFEFSNSLLYVGLTLLEVLKILHFYVDLKTYNFLFLFIM
jgi:hypothetical protein